MLFLKEIKTCNEAISQIDISLWFFEKFRVIMFSIMYKLKFAHKIFN